MSHRGRGRSGGSDRHHGYSGEGGRGAAQASSAPLLSSNRSFPSLGNGQGRQQQQQQPATVDPEPAWAPAPAPAPAPPVVANARPVNSGTRALSLHGNLSVPMQSSQGVMPRSNADASRWERATGSQRGLTPSPNNTSLQAMHKTMHKAERKYEVGKVLDKEEAKQRQLRAILNKLTPQNFERLFEQVKEVNIDSSVTLTGLVSQIYDRALLEPTFCAMYVNFCFHLAGVLPDFIDGDDNLITLRRLLLKKCQEEFERGEREQAEAEKVEEEGGIEQSEQEKEEKRLWSRRLKLGNIRFIGELFKKKMLTERIIHECIKKLLGQYRSPDEGDIEALCILMATIGERIDHSKAKVHMDAYFDTMHKLSTNDKISSRLRFMLRDSIDLRKNKWQQRREVEGPKNIEDVHRDAEQERLAVVRGGGGNHSFTTRGGSKMLEDMTQKSQLRVACNRSGGEVDSPGIRRVWIRKEPSPSNCSYNDTNEGEEKQVDKTR